MLEKVPSTATTSNTAGTIRPGGIPIQSASTTEATGGKQNGSCC
jgi:hypothetical protein